MTADPLRRACLGLSAILALIILLATHSVSTQAQSRGESSPIRGVVRAVRQATISSEAALRAVEVPFREGDRFKRGDLLVAFDCRRQIAEYEAGRGHQPRIVRQSGE